MTEQPLDFDTSVEIRAKRYELAQTCIRCVTGFVLAMFALWAVQLLTAADFKRAEAEYKRVDYGMRLAEKTCRPSAVPQSAPRTWTGEM